MGTTLLILCLPLNHKHNIVPPKLPAQCQTDSLNPAHKNSPLGVRQIRIILFHPNLIHRPQCLTPEPKTPEPKAQPKHQNHSLPHPNSPLGVRQIRIILLHANFIHRPQCLTPEPRTQSPTRHQNPKPPTERLNCSRSALKTNNPPIYIGGLPRKPKD